MKIGVLADDLTGAADAALAFERAGFSTEIALWGARRPAGAPRVWVLDTGSRGMRGPAARRRARAAAGLLKRWKAGFIFKKIDSTLRGPVGPELDGFLGAVGFPAGGLAFVPAFPAVGRTTVAGRHFVDGVPLHETAFGRDPRHPSSTSRVAEIAAAGRAARGNGTLLIPDVPDEAALRRAARGVVRSGARAAAGSAGFAEALARILRPSGLKRKAFRFPSARGGRVPAPVLVVSGSAHPASRRQAAVLAAGARASSGAERVLLVEAAARRGDAGAVLRALVKKAAVLMRGSGVARVAVTGGETAAALARATGTARWKVLKDVSRGVPLLVSVGARRKTWWVLKPGGFGQEDLWTRAIKLLSRT